jgi:hypothetical protein
VDEEDVASLTCVIYGMNPLENVWEELLTCNHLRKRTTRTSPDARLHRRPRQICQAATARRACFCRCMLLRVNADAGSWAPPAARGRTNDQKTCGKTQTSPTALTVQTGPSAHRCLQRPWRIAQITTGQNCPNSLFGAHDCLRPFLAPHAVIKFLISFREPKRCRSKTPCSLSKDVYYNGPRAL